MYYKIPIPAFSAIIKPTERFFFTNANNIITMEKWIVGRVVYCNKRRHVQNAFH